MSTDYDHFAKQNHLNPEQTAALLSHLEGLLAGEQPLVLAIDGRAASGKSSLAAKLGERFAAAVVHMDDFFLPQELRSEQRLSEAGGNLHHERFSAELLPQLRGHKGIRYQAFNCAIMQLDQWQVIKPAKLSIVEGCYALHPSFGKYYDMAVFMSCEPQTQLARINERNPQLAERFCNQWIPMEEAYFKAFDISGKCEIQLDT
ncbi:MAG: hypothetical protein VB108_03790 [Anaerolineaceae bacterium]|nr:hypothetical protein [Anaerolineaceae bacterium]